MEKGFEETALQAPLGIDGRALTWTYESLDEDRELEQFFSGIPGFCCSKVVDNPQSSLDSLRNWAVASALNGFLERTWSSNLVSETVKIRRLVTCVRAIDAVCLHSAASKIFDEFFANRHALFRSVELGHSLMSWSNNDNRNLTLFAQGIIACIISDVHQRNERWFSLTIHHLGISEHVLRGYLDCGDSVLLANLIHFARQFVRGFLEANWEKFPLSQILWRLVSISNVQNTLPELQHDFCGLWNEIVLQRRARDHRFLLNILEKIHPIYVDLHQSSTPFDQYELCKIPSHRIGSAYDPNEVEGDRTAEKIHAPITTSAIHHHDLVPSAVPPVTGHDARGTAADSIQRTMVPSSIPYMANTGSRATLSHIPASQPTRNMTTATPFFVLDTEPSTISLLTVGPDPTAPHISADPTAKQSGHPPEDGSISQAPSQILTPFSIASEVTSSFDSNAATEIGPLDDQTLDPNRRVMS
jgi:hypothetical protein